MSFSSSYHIFVQVARERNLLNSKFMESGNLEKSDIVQPNPTPANQGTLFLNASSQIAQCGQLASSTSPQPVTSLFGPTAPTTSFNFGPIVPIISTSLQQVTPLFGPIVSTTSTSLQPVTSLFSSSSTMTNFTSLHAATSSASGKLSMSSLM